MVSLLRRAAAALVLAVAATSASAGCSGPSLMERLDDDQRARLEAAAAATPYGEGLLWSASRGETRLLLVGTMHLHDERHLATLDALAPAIRDADLVLLEATPAEKLAMSRAIAETPGRILITDGPALPDLLGPETWALVADGLRERGIPPIMAARFRPWFLMMSMSLPPCAMADATAGREGLDGLVTKAAEAAGVPLAALEPWDTLFRLLEDEPDSEQIEALKSAFHDPGLTEEAIVATVDSYFAGHVAEVRELSRLAIKFLPEKERTRIAADLARMEEQVLTGRNQAWVPVIEAAALDNPRLIVAAGAAHLPGETGLLRLLEEEGWSIEALAPRACCERFWETP